MNVYRLYVEDLGTNWIAEVVETVGFDSFTIMRGVGYWKGKAEMAAVVEIICPNNKAGNILELADALRLELDQEAVLITAQKLDEFRIVESPKEQTEVLKEEVLA